MEEGDRVKCADRPGGQTLLKIERLLTNDQHDTRRTLWPRRMLWPRRRLHTEQGISITKNNSVGEERRWRLWRKPTSSIQTVYI